MMMQQKDQSRYAPIIEEESEGQPSIQLQNVMRKAIKSGSSGRSQRAESIKQVPFRKLELADGDLDDIEGFDEFSSISEAQLSSQQKFDSNVP
jgi:hypothetical protein